MEIRVQPAILEKDIESVKKRIEQIQPVFTEAQLDVMDGQFVPNDTVNDPVALSQLDWGNVDVFLHLMINTPMLFLKKWNFPAVKGMMFHFEAASNVQACIDLIKSMDKQVIIVVNPHTAGTDVKPYLDQIDGVMVMGVEPGFAAQAFNADVLDKIRYLREWAPEMDIYVDGGVNDSTKDAIMEAGANILCANSYLFKAPDLAEAKELLRTPKSAQ